MLRTSVVRCSTVVRHTAGPVAGSRAGTPAVLLDVPELLAAVAVPVGRRTWNPLRFVAVVAAAAALVIVVLYGVTTPGVIGALVARCR
jgi:hypothetical protein